ncbi:hypothetical protein [Pyruvatibacter sp.]|uniref:DUF4870 family protein n=1 Tax=Pyruvatibacter sp. TaxID=1981328 RepID=UPI0032659B35
MTDQHQEASPTQQENSNAPDPLMAHITYGLYAIGFLNGLTAIIGVVIAYVRRPDVKGTYLESHFTYLIRTFWISILYAIICTLLLVIGIGFILFFALAIWVIYRIVKGWIRLADAIPVDDPTSWI